MRESGELLEPIACAFCVITEWTGVFVMEKRPWRRSAAMAFCGLWTASDDEGEGTK